MKGELIMKTKNRLIETEIKYFDALQEWLTNPKNEDLQSEIVENEIRKACDEFVEALTLDEGETANFLSNSSQIYDIDVLLSVFEHFRSKEIYEAIKENIKNISDSLLLSEELKARYAEFIRLIEDKLI